MLFAQTRERLYATGYAALAQRDRSAALHAFAMMCAMSPLDERPWVGLAVAHEQAENWALAASFYRMGQQVACDSVWPVLGEGRARARLGDPRRAAVLFDRAEMLTSDASVLAKIEELRGEL
jgi:Flp pilus assembly protein TadD